MANFTKSSQTIIGAINVGQSIASALGLGSTLKTPQNSQKTFNDVRAETLAGIRKFGIQKTNLGYISFSLPALLRGVNGVTEQITLLARSRAHNFSIPSVNFATSEIKRYGVGPLEKKPYLPLFTDITVDFIGDSEGDIHKFFYIWMNGIINFTDLPKNGGRKDSYGTASKDPFAVEFKDNYKTDLKIRTFNDMQEALTEITLHNSFPVSLGEIQYNWGDENTLVRFPVTFNFTHWTYDQTDSRFRFSSPQVDVSKNNADLVYQFLINAYPAAQAIELATRRPQQVQDVVNIVNAGRSRLSPITTYF